MSGAVLNCLHAVIVGDPLVQCLDIVWQARQVSREELLVEGDFLMALEAHLDRLEERLCLANSAEEACYEWGRSFDENALL